MGIGKKSNEGGEGLVKSPKERWEKPVTVSFAIRDHTEDGYSTGSDGGLGGNTLTFTPAS